MTALPEEAFAAALAGLPAMGPSRLAALAAAWPLEEAWRRVLTGRAVRSEGVKGLCGPSPSAVGAAWRRAAGAIDVTGRWEEHRAAGAGIHILGHPGYPEELADDHEAPVVLFSRGSLDHLGPARVTIVGTRRCTWAGRRTAGELGGMLAGAGVTVVSGLALGIDAAAHDGALRAEGPLLVPPVAVVGSGLDVIYPRKNAALWDEVGRRGLLLSEAPLGTRPEAWRFPARNRILAALGQVTVVVESHLTGGSRHTVDAALVRGRSVYAVPGPVRSPASAGTNALLADGMPPARDAEDVLTGLRLAGVELRVDDGDAAGDGGSEILAAVDSTATALDTIVLRTGVAPAELATALARLERDGDIRCEGGFYERVRR